MQNLKEDKKERLVNLSPATVAMVIDSNRLVINKGAQHGIKFGQRFTVYELSNEDIRDPTTNEPLGRLETIKGTGTVVHIQDKMAILEATHESALIAFLESAPNSFKDPKVGDKAKPI